MTPERWQEIREVLDQALELKPTERAAFLDRACANDASLRKEVEVLLVSDEEAGPEFLNEHQSFDLTTAASSGGNPAEPSDTWIGRRVGTYKIVEQIGLGGMGEVYRAFRADDQYRKEVALKVVRGGQDSGFVVNRFKNERQILASLDHPNIARLHDGGTTEDGVPYFVMELIDGQPIDQYFNDHKLPVTERLKLFLQVCSAVQYAHQRLIIHRDIKPSNILVTSGGIPKLLDFGIAKILDAEAVTGQFEPVSIEPTLTVFRLLTPGYASPEQIKGEPITTASDVYSLGVVLYELLTGRHPYRRRSSTPQEIAHAVCEVEPEKPSTAVRRMETAESRRDSRLSSAAPKILDRSAEKRSKRLRGDLDNIVLMALRKEPQRRYASVEQFAEDIRRHLGSLPVVARKDTAGYRTSKFIARHKAGAIAAVVVAITVFAGLAVTLHEARIARVQQARAERRFNDLRKLANSLMFDIYDSIKDLPGTTTARKLLVTRALEYLDSLSRESNGDPSLQRELAAAYDRVGDVLGYGGAANLGDFAGASESYAKALTIREALASANPTDMNIQRELVDEYFRVAIVLENTGDFPRALITLQRALPFVQRIATSGDDPKMQDRLGGLYYYMGDMLEKSGDSAGGLENYRKAASIHAPLADDQRAGVFARAHVAGDYYGMARTLADTGQMDDAMEMAGKGLARLKQLSEANPTNATLREYLAEGYGTSSGILQKKGDLENALEHARRSYDIFKELKAADPSNQLAAENVVFGDLRIGEILVLQGKIAEGAQNIREALANFPGTGGSKSLWDATALSQAYSDLGMTYAALAGRAGSAREKARYWSEARSSYQKGLDAWNERPSHGTLNAFGSDPAARLKREIANCDANLEKLEAKTQLLRK